MCALHKAEGPHYTSFPELQAFKDGRDIILTSNEDIGTALRQVCENDVDNDAYILAQAARIVRKEIMNTTIQFDGYLFCKLKVCLNPCKL